MSENEGKTKSNEEKQKSTDRSKFVPKLGKTMKQPFAMRKANIEAVDQKVLSSSVRNTPNKESGVKLNAEMLNKLDGQASPPPFELFIPSESYAEYIEDSENDSDTSKDAELLYLEKKYLSKEFLFNNIEPQNSTFRKHDDCLRFEYLVNKILADTMIDYKWYFYIHYYVNKIIKTIRPNANRPNEVIDYNDYVTVRPIKWKNHLKWEYVSGMVLENKIADKHMKTNILDPKIVWIEGSLTFDSPKRNFLDIETIMKHEKYFLKSIEKWITTTQPNVIVVEKEVSRKIVEKLRDLGISLIMNVEKQELKRLAWLTQTFIIPSIDFLDENFKWGNCEEFIIQEQWDDKKYSKNTAHYHTKYSIYFRNWNPHLGCTICFTGRDLDELNQVGEWFQNILEACREELLGNGFEKRDYSEIMSRSIMNKTADGKPPPRPKTMSMIHKVKSFQPQIPVNDLERGGFIIRE